MLKVELTPSETENLIEFIELNFIDSVRKDTDISNMDYMVDMCNAYQKFKKSYVEAANKKI